MKACVVLVHGVLMPGDELRLLAYRLRRCGFRTVIFRYPTRRNDLGQNAARLLRVAAGLGEEPVHYVGHSLGGLVILAALRAGGLPRGRVVLLGSPVQGSGAARALAGLAPGRWLLGASVRDSLLAPVPGGAWDRDIGVIAGTLPVGLGRVLGRLQGANDGTVSVAETRLAGATDRLAVPVSHTGLVLAPRVARQVCEFLHAGRFTPDAGVPGAGPL